MFIDCDTNNHSIVINLQMSGVILQTNKCKNPVFTLFANFHALEITRYTLYHSDPAQSGALSG